jgi:hypothetical protein
MAAALEAAAAARSEERDIHERFEKVSAWSTHSLTAMQKLELHCEPAGGVRWDIVPDYAMSCSATCCCVWCIILALWTCRCLGTCLGRLAHERRVVACGFRRDMTCGRVYVLL